MTTKNGAETGINDTGGGNIRLPRELTLLSNMPYCNTHDGHVVTRACSSLFIFFSFKLFSFVLSCTYNPFSVLIYKYLRNSSCFHCLCFYSLSGFFALNNQSGALSLVKPLDYESTVQHVLNISAADMGEPRRQAFSDVTIHVTDANDNSPVLQERVIRAPVVEVKHHD